jgi:hypothetical protein
MIHYVHNIDATSVELVKGPNMARGGVNNLLKIYKLTREID